MSTLMSRDLNIERSSTRLHAPPGGKTSISFGDYDSSAPVLNKPRNTAPKSSISFGEENVREVRNENKINSNNVAGSRAPKSAQSLSSLISQDELTEDEKMKNKRKVAQKSEMSSIMNQENIQQPTRRVRQAPGGTSSLVLN